MSVFVVRTVTDVVSVFLLQISCQFAERVVQVDVNRWVVTAGGLGRGELEAMALYKQLAADVLLIDDHRARVIAEHNQIECIGALGLLLVAKRRGIISILAPYVHKLRQSSIFYSDDLLDHVLKLAGE